MTVSKIKLVVVLAALVLAGGLLAAVKRVTATGGSQQQGLSTPSGRQEMQTDGLDSQSDAGLSAQQAAGAGGREFFYRMLLSVSIVIVLGIAAVYASRKLLPRIANLPAKQIRVVETAYIAPRKGIHLIEVGTRRLVVASTNETITMLAEVTEPTTNFAAELEARSQKA